MDLLPAIDLKQGCCVRLKQGDMNQSDIYNTNPADQAKIFATQGTKWIHVVDLDGAFAGQSVNIEAVQGILSACPGIQIELGGGIRTFQTIEKWLDAGVTRVILGTIALKNPAFVKEACKEFENRVAVGIDAKNGFVAVEGWAETSDMADIELAKRFEDCGVSALIYTDISKDGILQGANIEATVRLASQISIPVIISGGISSLDDIKACAQYKIIQGIITGRALYERKFTVAEALSVLKNA